MNSQGDCEERKDTRSFDLFSFTLLYSLHWADNNSKLSKMQQWRLESYTLQIHAGFKLTIVMEIWQAGGFFWGREL